MSNVWRFTRRQVQIAIGLLLWTFGIAVGSLYSLQYELTPATTEHIVEQWPTDSSQRLASDRPTLVMFVHPRCPCTRASVEELTELMSRQPDRLHAQVIFFQPPSASADWVETDLWSRVASIPSVQRHVDRDGSEQRKFTATVSGEVFVYLPHGELAFHGGITPRRGHAGENAGRQAIELLLQQPAIPVERAPVFGCRLTSERASSRDDRSSCEAKADR